MQDKTNYIKENIGQNKADDYILSPEAHFDLYREKLPSLSNLLDNAQIKYLSSEYSLQDKRAIESQRKFKKYSYYTRISTFLAVTFSSTLILAGSLSNIKYIISNINWLVNLILVGSTILTIAFSAISGALIMILRNQQLLRKWMERRAEAEELRLKYFTELTDQSNKDNSIEVLWYIKRYLIDMQASYYGGRSVELEKKTNKASVLVAAIAAIVIVINGTSGTLSSIYGIEWTSLTALALIIHAFSFTVTNKELNDQNARNSERYSRTRSALALLATQVDQVERSLQQGNTDALKKYVLAINEIVSAEHRQWLKNIEMSNLAINELEKELSKIKHKND